MGVQLGIFATLFAMTKEERLIIVTGGLVGVLILGATIIARVDRWRKRQHFDQVETSLHVGNFREMYENGEITKDEYDRVIRKMALKPKAGPAPAEAKPQPPVSGLAPGFAGSTDTPSPAPKAPLGDGDIPPPTPPNP
jgi:uncharacterized membrane protein